MIATSERLKGIGEYYFSQKLKEIEALNAQGKNIINLGIGSPDLPPHPSVIETLQTESGKSNTHAYQSYKGSPVLRKSISNWYKNAYSVTIDPDTEILPLMGSKEGIMHICMTYLNIGDMALVPNPGYPTYKAAVTLAGAECLDYNLSSENNYFPDFDALEKLNLTKVKIMWVNYPHMPTGAKASKQLFKKLVVFGLKHKILICHDNPYSFILNEEPLSILQTENAFDTAIELNSLSKSHNMAGWRVGMVCGHNKRIEEILRFKSNMDSGMFLPVQLAAAKALELDETWYTQVNETYSSRRQKAFHFLNILGCDYSKDQVGLFVWAKVPEDKTDGFKLSDEVLYNSNVFITPGGIFGTMGDKFVRVSLCASEETFDTAIKRINNN